jgi:Tfp pilus assembly protein PilN
MWNPLRSERDMFRFLVQVGGVVVVLIVLVVVLRAIF